MEKEEKGLEKKNNKKKENITIEEIPKKGNNLLGKALFVLFTLLICSAASIGINVYLSEYGNHVDSSNRNITVDDTGIADAVSKIYDAVVVVENYSGDKLYGSGSGFVYKTDKKYGYILTNSHVLSNNTSMKVVFTTNKRVEAEIVGTDEFSDVAVLRVPVGNVIQVAILGDNSKMRVGDTTFAVGAPVDAEAYSWSVTRGILSGKDRMVAAGNSYMNVLQTDTAINSGNSGGPLCNANGEVIGITNMKLASAQIEGMSFAIPIETASKYADKFVKGENLKRPYLGVALYDNVSYIDGSTTVVVDSVEDGSSSAKAGLKSGDVIKKIGNVEVEGTAHFKYQLYNYNIGDKVKITIMRDNKEKVITIKLEANTKEA